jgi:hypothetical protein
VASFDGDDVETHASRIADSNGREASHTLSGNGGAIFPVFPAYI